jgi:hypothetical protein
MLGKKILSDLNQQTLYGTAEGSVHCSLEGLMEQPPIQLTSLSIQLTSLSVGRRALENKERTTDTLAHR